MILGSLAWMSSSASSKSRLLRQLLEAARSISVPNPSSTNRQGGERDHLEIARQTGDVRYCLKTRCDTRSAAIFARKLWETWSISS